MVNFIKYIKNYKLNKEKLNSMDKIDSKSVKNEKSKYGFNDDKSILKKVTYTNQHNIITIFKRIDSYADADVGDWVVKEGVYRQIEQWGEKSK